MNLAIPMFITWVILTTIALILILKKKPTKKISTVLYIASIIIGGFAIGGIPNAIMPIQQLLMVFGTPAKIASTVLLMVALIMLLLTTIIFGRIFCGYACPLGALQEIGSNLKFKSEMKSQKKVKNKIELPKKAVFLIRWGFFGLMVLLGVIWGIALLQVANPFLGFSVFRNSLGVMIIIPVIILTAVLVSSLFVYRPWCRLLCPFGTLASVTSRFSIYKYRRTEKCNDCELCEKICPTAEAGRESTKSECYFCNRCVDICPQDAIELRRK